MRRTIGDDVYDSDNAEWIGEVTKVIHRQDTLFKTPEGKYFVLRISRPFHIKGVDGGWGMQDADREIMPATEQQASLWLTDNDQSSALERAGLERIDYKLLKKETTKWPQDPKH